MPYACDNPQCQYHVAIPAFMKDTPRIRVETATARETSARTDAAMAEGWSLRKAIPPLEIVVRHKCQSADRSVLYFCGCCVSAVEMVTRGLQERLKS